MSETLQEVLALAFVLAVLAVTVAARLRARSRGRPPACHGCPSEHGCASAMPDGDDVASSRSLPLHAGPSS